MKRSLRKKLADHASPCWTPKLAKGDGSSTSSKFSGLAYVPPGESWPCCSNCQNPLQLFLQLNSNELPDQGRPFGQGLLQLFYCTNSEPHCEVDCEAFFPFSRAVLVRIVRDFGEVSTVTQCPVKNAFPPRKIKAWKQRLDYPDLEDVEVDATEKEEDSFYDSGFPLTGDKLLGHPHWVQGPEYPNCPDCKAPMRYLFQIDSEESLPYMFGDSGVGHVTQCEKHPDRLAFGWACC